MLRKHGVHIADLILVACDCLRRVVRINHIQTTLLSQDTTVMRSLLDHASVSLKSDDWLSKVVNPHRKHERHKAGIGSLTCYAIGLSEPALDRVDAWRRQTASTCHVRIGQKSPFKIECIWRSSLDEMRMTRTNSDISVKVIRHQRWAAKAFRLTEVAMLILEKQSG